ncbi:MAG: A/G-specific adenine glycosylase [Flavobacteriales bacterium]|nr:A/G-specific adenine glycosylase [Crocinitomicaceae bacterium]NBX81086.1 A/G-specific adenine glycosylase [Flavobacteriales bacterium]
MFLFQDVMVDWYQNFKRDLPWRNTRNPYKIWLSEIILQQTRVDQGLPYYEKFISHYPTVFELANADEQEILNDWQGLGYYSRARNLHKTAKEIVALYNGVFPDNYQDLLKLTGIGPYTAAAISSFAFDEVKAVVDGNVYRVLSRFYDIEEAIDSTTGKKNFDKLANELIDSTQPATYNQAIMEFGALQCVPVNPNCEICPLRMQCLSFKNKTIALRPVKTKKTKTTLRYFVYEIKVNKSNKFILEKREGKGIWQGLYQFPLKEFVSQVEKDHYIENLKSDFVSKEYKHILSHQRILATFVLGKMEHSDLNANQIEVRIEDFSDFPVPRLMDKFWEENYAVLMN